MPPRADLHQWWAEQLNSDARSLTESAFDVRGFRMSLWQDGRHQAELRVAGPVVGEGLDALRAQLRCLLNTGISALVVDLSNVTIAGPGLVPTVDFVQRLIRVRHGELCIRGFPVPMPPS